MRILCVTAQKIQETGSGVYIRETMKYWTAMGHEVSVVYGNYKGEELRKEEKIHGYSVEFNSPSLPFSIAGMSDEMPYESVRYCDFTEEMKNKFLEAFCGRLKEAIEQERPQVIVCHHLYLLTAWVRKWFPDIPIIGICHGSDLRQLQKNVLWQKEIKEGIRSLEVIVALQKKQQETIAQLFSYPKEKIQVVGVGYAGDIFKVKQVDKKKNSLIFAGKIAEKKGVASLLRSISYISPKKLPLTLYLAGGAGNKKEYEMIEQLAKECPHEVYFLGPLKQIELANWFQHSEVFVLPSYFEGLPIVNLEAMACGCKVIASAIPGVPEWINEHIEKAPITFVPLPKMENVDVPDEKEREIFEKNLRQAICEVLESPAHQVPDLSLVSWEGISGRLIDVINEKALL